MMPLEEVALRCQKCTSNEPVIVLGSGASIPYGIRGMKDLAVWLGDNVEPAEGDEFDAWSLVKSALKAGDHLEAALEKNVIPAELIAKIVRSTWSFVSADDYTLLKSAIKGEVNFPLKTLLAGLFRSTNRNIQVITTNYDRVAEYAADSGGFIHHNGFLPGYLRRTEGAEDLQYRQGSHQAKTVRLWKVHGSVDWFLDAAHGVISLPLTDDLPDGLVPLIVTPGVNKYQLTHGEPFRSVIQGADRALQGARAIICIGYGFRDEHIHPKLVMRCRMHDVPILMMAGMLTPEARAFLADEAGRNFIALEDHSEGTMAYSVDYPDGEVLEGEKYWKTAVLNELVGF